MVCEQGGRLIRKMLEAQERTLEAEKSERLLGWLGVIRCEVAEVIAYHRFDWHRSGCRVCSPKKSRVTY